MRIGPTWEETETGSSEGSCKQKNEHSTDDDADDAQTETS